MLKNIPPHPDPRAIFAPDALKELASAHIIEAFRPVERGIGAEFVEAQLLGPLSAALPNYEVRVDLALRGHFKGGDWTASSGHLCGIFAAPLYGIAPTGRVVYLRFGCFQRWSEQ